MSSQISCRNVVKVKFDGKSDAIVSEPKGSEKTASKASPMLHPSLSLENLNAPINREAGKPEQCTSPLRSSATKPPREKQLHSIKLLVEQHNSEVEASDEDFICLIDAEWLNAWYRFAVSNDPALYPGAISNWSLIASNEQDEDTQGHNEDTFNNAHDGLTTSNTLTGGSSANSLTSPAHSTLTAAALAHRRTAMRGLSFDGEECDFAEELEQFQNKAQQLQQAAGSPAKQSQAKVQSNMLFLLTPLVLTPQIWFRSYRLINPTITRIPTK